MMGNIKKWRIYYAKRVIRNDIPKLDTSAKSRISKAIETKLQLDPLRFGKPLRHSLNNLRSLRVGDYRVIYHVEVYEKLVKITTIGHRRDVYG